MSLSLNEQANSRKSRLSKLREDRKLEKESTGDVQTQSILDQNTNGATPVNSTNEDIIHDTNNSSIRSRNFDLETRDAVSGIKNPPTLALSNNETVEVLASQIQRDILQGIRHKADEASSGQDEGSPLEKHESAYHSKDLKADLAYYFNKADTKTNQAINRILQTKYQNSIH
ncbi:DEHA2F07964p [Debaryomyces hansenii CBS767]|uniref:DEHA2F07964p n=1 Tax=Debaryomyces hansenii (strain ATCC 36239 / CBS 767 / BCRC 21394 / JCM 1990 / NBRC 0083 / IGC 2968) TaxID=284592 RepID=Q6BM65_DEBHA|nr:DEHA2F07964p [Debaryomyces hansenii CBS767]CAG89046.2 DEHA2F07964p [Debaryomyces hansenii CBS767]|eukprot:XP_460706.2 DEHA2F07964p [Debaryomyces hansenii CBS767]